MDVHSSLAGAIGNTPLVRLNRVTAGLAAPVYAKVEFVNPGGSVKDRAALAMVDGRRAGRPARGRAARSSRAPRATPESGLAHGGRTARLPLRLRTARQEQRWRRSPCCVPTVPRWWSARAGYRVSTRTMSTTPPLGSPPRRPGAWHVNQYDNTANPTVHYESTGPEIWGQTGRPGHASGGRRGHRRHDQRDRTVPQGGQWRTGDRGRCRSGGVGLLGRRRTARTSWRASGTPGTRRPWRISGRSPTTARWSTGSSGSATVNRS